MKITRSFKRATLTSMLLSSMMANAVLADTVQTTFRNSFIGLMGNEPSKDQKLDLIYPVLPAQNLLDAKMESGEQAEDFFNRIRTFIPSPDDFKKTSAAPNEQTDLKAIEDYIRTNVSINGELPLFILVPGIFGEFIADHPFQDVIDNVSKNGGSAYNTEFMTKLQALAATNNISASDLRLQLSNMNYESFKDASDAGKKVNGQSERPLKELVLVGALKDTEGKVIANTLTLDTKALSLESLSALRNNSKMFVRRVSKFFNVMESIPKNIIIVGYSRGVPISLDMVALGSEKDCSQLSKNTNEALEHGCTSNSAKSWTKNIRGFLSVAGVIYGSELADVSFPDLHRSPLTPGAEKVLSDTKPAYLRNARNTTNAIKVEALQAAAKALAYTQSVPEVTGNSSKEKIESLAKRELIIAGNAKTKIENFGIWADLITTMAKVQGKTVEAQVGDLSKELFADFKKGKITEEGLKEKLTEKVTILQNSFETNLKVDLNATIKQGLNMLKGAFGDLNYNSNILQFKTLVKETIDAASDLTTASRLLWWSTHTIPTEGIKYYSVSATMMASDQPEIIAQNRESSKYSYNLDTVDFSNLWGSYKTFITLGDNFDNNDSQVSLHKSTFRPQIAGALNANQAVYQAQPLAVFHTHHWGLTLRSVTQVKGVGAMKTEPFPRPLLLQSTLAAMIVDGQLEK